MTHGGKPNPCPFCGLEVRQTYWLHKPLRMGIIQYACNSDEGCGATGPAHSFAASEGNRSKRMLEPEDGPLGRWNRVTRRLQRDPAPKT